MSLSLLPKVLAEELTDITLELLHSLGLSSPDPVELCWELNREEHIQLPLDKLDPEECAQALYDWLKA